MADVHLNLEDWEGALGPQSDDEPLFYELTTDGEEIRLVGPSPGQKFEHSRDEFIDLVAAGEWIVADDDWENQVYLTPDGERPY
ncbi:hypothetical protein [Halopelagius longus]|uniref:Uncharacterized protein n=1 Tax=Halopelagius longus TaxID=1236180 RepID=A0A1H0XP86_9EURY|nr:hypothetical protein [Halopelagius longus]RDI71985.1 hypothetical protein DWB78_09765 [Halopelagius longus]SDQ04643.1 hypothetical protein SAMN05216278_0056 [Halopelagius longus]